MYTSAAKKLRKNTVSQGIAPNSNTLTGNSGAVSEYFISGELTEKERDPETGLYYYGARYLDPRTSRWISADPAMWEGDYFPSAPINDQARERNQNLPGMGGIFNYVNFHVYHYGGNNPVKLTDPDGRDIKLDGRNITRAFNYLYENSPTFRSSLRTLLRSVNNRGERLYVLIVEEGGTYPGFTQSEIDVATFTIPETLTIDERGNIIFGNINEGETVQLILITIDMEKIGERKLNILEVLTEEFMHAVDAASMGTAAFNEAIERERNNFTYGDGPMESSAKERTQIVLGELP